MALQVCLSLWNGCKRNLPISAIMAARSFLYQTPCPAIVTPGMTSRTRGDFFQDPSIPIPTVPSCILRAWYLLHHRQGTPPGESNYHMAAADDAALIAGGRWVLIRSQHNPFARESATVSQWQTNLQSHRLLVAAASRWWDVCLVVFAGCTCRDGSCVVAGWRQQFCSQQQGGIMPLSASSSFHSHRVYAAANDQILCLMPLLLSLSVLSYVRLSDRLVSFGA